MLLCDHCGGESTVVLTRQVVNEMLKTNKKKGRTLSVVRTRQCVDCRWKWRTIERLYKPTQARKRDYKREHQIRQQRAAAKEALGVREQTHGT